MILESSCHPSALPIPAYACSTPAVVVSRMGSYHASCCSSAVSRASRAHCLQMDSVCGGRDDDGTGQVRVGLCECCGSGCYSHGHHRYNGRSMCSDVCRRRLSALGTMRRLPASWPSPSLPLEASSGAGCMTVEVGSFGACYSRDRVRACGRGTGSRTYLLRKMSL